MIDTANADSPAWEREIAPRLHAASQALSHHLATGRPPTTGELEALVVLLDTAAAWLPSSPRPS